MIIGLYLKQTCQRSFKINHFSRGTVYQVCGREESLIPKLQGHGGMGKRESPTSTICRCFLSADPFCWWAWGQETWWVIPNWQKKEFRRSYSPPQSVCIVIIFLLNNLSTRVWNSWKTLNTSDRCLSRYTSREPVHSHGLACNTTLFDMRL